ncbi:retrovirus-related pol polyprotein from transposon TNT 1-94 [Tanacetum coccineum]|uniref:Retrovirus-related pol polyprotein from transposon TNT 1-94 n=1 Tax=Tanacetum coccineum TaxID=301880 RepID=A0ABQ5ARY7_9ASTR
MLNYVEIEFRLDLILGLALKFGKEEFSVGFDFRRIQIPDLRVTPTVRLQMLGLRLVLPCYKEVVAYHGQADSDDTFIERGRHKNDDLTGDDLKQYEADIKAMNLIIISIPYDIYNYVDACENARDMGDKYEKRVIASREKKAAKTHDPLALVAHTSSSSSRSPPPYYVTHPPSVEWWLNARRSYNTQEESTESSNVQKETGNVQRTLRTSSLGNATNVQCYNCNAKGHYARDCIKPRVRDSKYFIEQMLLAKKDEDEVILFNEQNDFLLEDAAKMEEIEELIISEVQTPSTSFMNPLFFKSDHEQTYHEQPKIINSTTAGDPINSDIFDDPNVEINDGKVKHDKNVHDQQDTGLELLARNAFKEAEKQLILAKTVKQQNVELTKDKIRALEKERDDLQISVSNKRKQVLELKNAHTSLKHKFNTDEDKYLDSILKLEAKVKPILDYLHTVFKAIQKEFPEDVREMMNVFDSMESNLDETLTQNEILRDRLLEATLTHDVEKCVLMLADSMND